MVAAMHPGIEILNAREQVAAHYLGEPLKAFVLARRPGRSWRLIARDVYDKTDGQVDVTGQSLRNWYGGAQVDVA
jgi:hypothetical protein